MSLRGFRDDRFVYARLGESANHSVPVYSLFAKAPEKHYIHRFAGRDVAAVGSYTEKVRYELAQALAESSGKTLCLSGENITELSRDGLESLRNFFLAENIPVKIIAYVRPPASYITSALQESIKIRACWNTHIFHLNYRTLFEKFDLVFGRKEVELWKFDPARFVDGDVVKDFCSRLNIALPDDRIVRVNESLSRQAVAFIYTYRKFCHELGASAMPGGEADRLGRALLRTGNDKFRISPDVIRPLLERHRSSIQWMENRIGASLKEELGEPRDGDVREETDLLRHDDEAVTKLRELLVSIPKDVKGRGLADVARLVHALRIQLANAASIKAVQNEIRLDPNAGIPYHRLALLLSRQGEWAEAVAMQRTAARLMPKDAAIIKRLCHFLEQTGNLGEAIQVARDLVKLDPDRAQNHVYLANLYSRTGQPQEALMAQCRAILLAPNRRDLLVRLCEFQKMASPTMP